MYALLPRLACAIGVTAIAAAATGCALPAARLAPDNPVSSRANAPRERAPRHASSEDEAMYGRVLEALAAVETRKRAEADRAAADTPDVIVPPAPEGGRPTDPYDDDALSEQIARAMRDGGDRYRYGDWTDWWVSGYGSRGGVYFYGHNYANDWGWGYPPRIIWQNRRQLDTCKPHIGPMDTLVLCPHPAAKTKAQPKGRLTRPQGAQPKRAPYQPGLFFR